MKHFTLLLVLLSFFVAPAVVPTEAQAGDFFFPNVKRQAREQYEANKKAEEEMKAPFIAEEGLTQAQTGRISSVPLSLPNLNDLEVSGWVSSAVTDALTLAATDVLNNVSKANNYFTPSGQRQYIEFLNNTNITKNLSSGHYQLNSAVQLEPLLIGQQEANGRYKWLYDLDILLSYLNAGTTTYEGTAPQNQVLKLRVQVTRVEATLPDDDGIRIELWQKR